MIKDAVTLRALHPGDRAFIERLFAGSRAEEMSHTGWPAEQIAAFLSQQFNAQHTYYQAHYSDGELLIIELYGQPIGRLYMFWGPTTLNLIDITLLPEFQGRGIGSTLIEAQLRRADEQGLKVELFVEYFNPAQRLYGRLGFHVCGDSGVYLKLRRDARTDTRKVS
ncbi:N-acetyltransferase [Pseudomonas parafulva]|uniref:N-acetyltransferase n=1 Tax=Pseudomonas parafulva TaxID=157782 RepID=A0AAI8KE55_9PSED|nr:GNAT family N-acetyltransferase [Pseudomonas parafulva]AIZ34139.1 acetyltransferase [Pseudomonas parafulva]AXO89855.1 N-acetyltransferase [Pseudomonas parafulva]